MILLYVLLQASIMHYPNTAEENDLCASDPEGQTERMCLADRKSDRAKKELAAALAAARQALTVQSGQIESFKRNSGATPTLEGDPVQALEQSQTAWKKSMSADCLVYAFQFATAAASTTGVIEKADCEADRTLDRVRFLRSFAN